MNEPEKKDQAAPAPSPGMIQLAGEQAQGVFLEKGGVLCGYVSPNSKIVGRSLELPPGTVILIAPERMAAEYRAAILSAKAQALARQAAGNNTPT